MAESERRQAHLRAWGNGIEAVILNIVQGAPPLAWRGAPFGMDGARADEQSQEIAGPTRLSSEILESVRAQWRWARKAPGMMPGSRPRAISHFSVFSAARSINSPVREKS